MIFFTQSSVEYKEEPILLKEGDLVQVGNIEVSSYDRETPVFSHPWYTKSYGENTFLVQNPLLKNTSLQNNCVKAKIDVKKQTIAYTDTDSELPGQWGKPEKFEKLTVFNRNVFK